MPTFLEVCLEAADRAGQILLDWRERFKPSEKGPRDLVTEADFEERWQRDVASRYGWLAGATAAAFAWCLLGLVVAGLALLRRRRDAERRARLEAVPWGGPPDEPNA